MKDLNEGLGRGSRIPKDGNHSRNIAFLRKNFKVMLIKVILIKEVHCAKY